MRRCPASVLAAVAGIATLVAPPSSCAQAPCSLTWRPGEGIPGLDGVPYAMANWDPDGAGPQPAVVVVGGQFTVAGDQLVGNVALYDPALRRWSSLGAGVAEPVNAIVVRNGAVGGPLVVGTNAGVRAWNGTTWQPLGLTFNSAVNHLVELANGDLVAGGAFGLVGGSAINTLVRWDGSQWLALGNPTMPFSIGSILGLAVLPNGDLVAGGSFLQVGGVACSNVARWDGTLWHPLGAGASTPVLGLIATPAGDVVAMGGFGISPLTVARWDGAGWQVMPPAPSPTAFPVAPVGSNGVLFRSNSALWLQDAGGWSQWAVWTGTAGVRCVALLPNGDALIGGAFTQFDGKNAWRVAIRRSGVFEAANSGGGGVGTVQAAVPSRDGGYFVGGSFRVGGMPNANLAYFDGISWTQLPVPATTVREIVARDDGSLLLRGVFSLGGTQTLLGWQNGVATAVPLPLGAGASALAEGQGATWVATTLGITVGVARWDGTFLVPLPFAVPGTLSDLVELPNGDLVLAGAFQTTGSSQPLRWDGQQLAPIPGAPGGVQILAVAANGDLLVGGILSAPFSCVARWDGSTWHALGALPLNDGALSLDALPNGDVVLSQLIGLAPTVTRIQRWDGQSWTVLGEARGSARVVWSPAGELAAFGDFTRVDSTVAALFTRLQSSCAATVLDLGGGCSGSAGPLTTRVDERAWLGGTFQATTRGVATNALALGVFGASTTSLPLPQLLPIGGAGCTVRATPDVVGFAPVWNGEAEFELSLPSAPALLGASFVQQTLVLETAAGSASALLSGPGTQLTVGAW